MMYQSRLDLTTGKGMYVQSLGGPGGDTLAYVAAEDALGNVFAVGYTSSQSIYASSMQETIQTLPLEQSEIGTQYIAVKFGTGSASETPWCVSGNAQDS